MGLRTNSQVLFQCVWKCLNSLTILSYTGTHTHAYTNSSWRKSEHLKEKVYFTLGDLSYIIYTQKSLRGNHKNTSKCSDFLVPLPPKLYNRFCSLSSLPGQSLLDLIIKQRTWKLKLFRKNFVKYFLSETDSSLLSFLHIFIESFSPFSSCSVRDSLRRCIHIWTWWWYQTLCFMGLMLWKY